MAYSIKRDDSHIITVTFKGVVGLAERLVAVDEVCELVSSSGLGPLLIDIREITMDMSLSDQEYLGKYLSSRGELANAKVAVLHSPQGNPNMAIDAFAYNEGYRVAEFDMLEDAMSWLIGRFK